MGQVLLHLSRSKCPRIMRYLLRRAGFFLLTLWAAVTLNFFLPRMMPGNPAIAMMGKFRGRLTAPARPKAWTIFG